MQIWIVHQKHIEKEGEELVAVVIAPSEQNAREMLSEKDGGFDPRYGRTDWLSEQIATCKCIGIANESEKPAIIMFQPIVHNLVYGRSKQMLDFLYLESMQRIRKK